jgi:hypothetical protein
MAKFDKYIDFEFEFNGTLMNYTGVCTESLGGFDCVKCGKPLKSKAHAFTGSINGEEWLFGNDCVKYVFGAGLVTLKESQKQDR